jgi:hypothetical protein
MQRLRQTHLRRPLGFLLAFGCLWSAACSWFSATTEVPVRVPEPPEHWRRAFPDLAFRILTPSGEGTAGLVRLPKVPNWPVLAVPTARGVPLPPAGALWPWDLEGEELVLSWEHGPAAEVFAALVREGVDIAPINGERLLEEMGPRGAGDPWALDLAHISERLASGIFRVTDIRLLPCRDVELAEALLPPAPSGEWFLESPFCSPLALEPGQPLRLPRVPLGHHRLFSVASSTVISLDVGETGVTLFNHAPSP